MKSLAARLFLCLPLLAGPALASAPATAPAAGWTYEKYRSAMEASGRKVNIDARAFGDIQKRKGEALAAIEEYLRSRLGKADPAVLRAFAEVPREYFHHDYKQSVSTASQAYEKEAKAWAIGYGSALSDFLGQAYMTQITKAGPESVVLEIGTGSGFQSALLSRIAKKVHSIEIIEPLGQAVTRVHKPLGYDNVETRVGDGFFGWPEVKGGFDIIIVTCAAQYVPPALIEQLKPGGRLIIPIGQPFKRGQILYVYSKDADGKVQSRKDVGVFFIPMTGHMMKASQAAGAK